MISKDCPIIILLNNLKIMTTLPLINPRETTLRKKLNISYLRFPKTVQLKPTRYSLQQQAYTALHDHKYLYIDFQTENKLLELERTDEIKNDEEEAETIGQNQIGGFQTLSKVSPLGYRMHKFLSQEKLYFQRKKKWKSLLSHKPDDTQMNFNKIRQNINPEKLQDYLENKNIQANWKKIQERQQKLYHEISNQTAKIQEEMLSSNHNRFNTCRRLKAKQNFNGKVKLKALNKLNSLLEKSYID